MTKMIQAIILDWMGTLYEVQRGVYPFSGKVLEYLKPKYKIGLVTIAVGGIARRSKEIEESGLSQYFDAVVIEPQKSRAEYNRCIRQLGVSAHSTAVVDDQYGRILTAQSLGCRLYWVTDDREINDNSITKISTVEELIEAL